MKPFLSISRLTLQEMRHHRATFLFLFFSAFSSIAAWLTARVSYDSQLKVALDFSFAAMEWLLILFTVYFSIALMGGERQKGLGLLALPLTRTEFLWGRFWGQWLFEAGLIFAMGLWLYLGHLWLNGNLGALVFTQLVFSVTLKVSVVAAVTYFFSSFMRPVLSALSVTAVVLIGYLRAPFAEAIRNDTILTRANKFLAVFPDFSLLDLKNLLVHGVTQTPGVLFWAMLYTSSCVIFFLIAATICFQFRDIHS